MTKLQEKLRECAEIATNEILKGEVTLLAFEDLRIDVEVMGVSISFWCGSLPFAPVDSGQIKFTSKQVAKIEPFVLGLLPSAKKAKSDRIREKIKEYENQLKELENE